MSLRADASKDVASFNADVGVSAVYKRAGAGAPATVENVYVGAKPAAARESSMGGSYAGYERSHRENVYTLTAPLAGPEAAWTEGDIVADDGGIVELRVQDTFVVPGRMVGEPDETVTVRGAIFRGQGHWSAEVAL